MVALAVWIVSAAVVAWAALAALYAVALVVIAVFLVAGFVLVPFVMLVDCLKEGHRERVRTRGRYFAPRSSRAPASAPPRCRMPSAYLPYTLELTAPGAAPRIAPPPNRGLSVQLR